MSQEEVRLQSRRGDGNEYVYRVANQRGFWEFYNCSQTGHISRFCRRDRGRGYSVGSSSRGGWNGSGGSWNASHWNAPKANVAASAEGKQQEDRRLLLAMPTLSIQMKVILNTHQ
uniref:CCHC-type domain-containing protein n=1 Tax=Aegilops tauschii subsp. strangulata TaxID=200361 RepID=A0A453QW49_AEGTS